MKRANRILNIVLILLSYSPFYAHAQDAYDHLAHVLSEHQFEIRSKFIESSLIDLPTYDYSSFLSQKHIASFKVEDSDTHVDLFSSQKIDFPHIDMTTVFVSFGKNMDEPYMSISEFDTETCEYKFRSDFGVYVDLQLKDDFQLEEAKCRLYYLWKQDRKPIIVLLSGPELSAADKELIYNFRFSD